ncbi:hypothetical protein ES702_00519 [subsurface metagenome]
MFFVLYDHLPDLEVHVRASVSYPYSLRQGVAMIPLWNWQEPVSDRASLLYGVHRLVNLG